ncbi:MAG: hypothetical protein GY835_00910 [bacterium]|nr:hypothetical protein [bacterium]
MRRVLRFRWRCLALAALLCLAGQALAKREAVSSVVPYLLDDDLYCTVHLGDLFPEAIGNTLRSGLPVVFDLGIEMLVVGSDYATAGFLHNEVDYDVWDDIYRLRRRGRISEFTDFAAMEVAAKLVDNIFLCRTAELSPASEFRLSILLEISPLSSEHRSRMANWVTRTINDPGDPEARELRLNLGGMIGSIFDRGRDEALWGGQGEFGPWRLDDLPRRVAPAAQPPTETGGG